MYEELVKELRGFAAWHSDSALLNRAADAIEGLSKPRWIPVTERLPKKNGKYLCYVKRFGQYAGMQYYYVDVLVFQEDCFYEDEIGTERVTHWMPLPEPPKEET